jgi:hypothetical protein
MQVSEDLLKLLPLPLPKKLKKLRTPQRQALGELFACARDRGSSIHTRLGFMQRRLVKIEIISDTI